IAAPKIELSKQVKDIDRHLAEYLKLHDRFNKKVCTPGAEEKYWELYRDFRGDGHYIPVLGDGKLDRMTVSRFVPEIESKIAWIGEQKKILAKRNGFADVKVALNLLKERLEKSLDLKYKIFREKDEKKQVLLKVESK